MKLNTLKSKLVAGTAAVALLSGAGLVAANTDAGTALQNWYNGAFGVAVGDIQEEVTDYGQSEIPGLYNEYTQLRSGATSEINNKKATEETTAKADINAAKDSHILAVNDKEAIIAEYMASNFDTISAAGNVVLNNLGNQAFNYASSDLTTLTGQKGSVALTDLTTQLEAEKNLAVTELGNEIADAKEALLIQIGNEKNSTVEELKAAIDAKIIELRGTITAKKDALVLVQTNLITAKAQELEDAAIADLNSLVAGINN